jgi:hypothetical protein
VTFHRWLEKLRHVLKPRTTASPASRLYRPTLESLEDRRVLHAGHFGWGPAAAFGFGGTEHMRVLTPDAAGDTSGEPTGTQHGGCGGTSSSGSQQDSTTATNVNQTRTYTEGDATVALNDIVVSNPDANATVTATLKLANPATGSLTATSGNGETYAPQTGVWTVTGSLTAVNAALAAVAFKPNPNNDVDTTIAVSIHSGAANTSSGHCGWHGDDDDDVTGTITLDADPVNNPPTATNLNQTKAYTAGASSVALDPIVVSDPDTNETITATLTPSDPAAGSLSDSQGIGKTDSTTGAWSVSGSVSTVNAALAGVTFAPAAGNTTGATIGVTIRDAAGTGPDGTITLTAIPATTGPTATNLTQTHTYTAGAASVSLDAIVVSDADANATITATLTLADVAAGSLTANSGNGETYNATTGVWTVTGSLSSVNAALAAVAFIPAANNTSNTTTAVAIRDAAGAGPDGTITLNTVTPVVQDAVRTAV